MTDTITSEDLVRLSEVEGPCVSIHLPTSPTGRERLAGKIRLKNLAAQAEQRLVESGMRPTEARDLLKPATELVADEHFWERPLIGLALFVAPRFSWHCLLDHAPLEHVAVGDSFHVRPLLSLFRRPDFYVLAIDQHQTRLVRVRNQEVARVTVFGMPERLDDVVGLDESENQTQWHTAGRLSPTHNAGDRATDPKNMLLRFSQAIDRELARFFAGSRATLVLAADEPVLSIFRGACTLEGLLDGSIKGSPSAKKDEQLADEARPIVEGVRQARLDSLVKRFADLKPHDRASDVIEEVQAAIGQGRVGILLAAKAVVNGQDTGAVDQAITETIKHGGTVYELPPEMMPTQQSIAAIFRY
jgi:hypothetical protein